jgi:hypothetical protein
MSNLTMVNVGQWSHYESTFASFNLWPPRLAPMVFLSSTNPRKILRGYVFPFLSLYPALRKMLRSSCGEYRSRTDDLLLAKQAL